MTNSFTMPYIGDTFLCQIDHHDITEILLKVASNKLCQIKSKKLQWVCLKLMMQWIQDIVSLSVIVVYNRVNNFSAIS
jgi:hypothetical protein